MRTMRHASLFCALLALTLVLTLALAGCGMRVDRDEQGKEKKVDIETPLGGLHVRKNIDPKETGLPVYPGARPTRGDETSSANVNIDSSFFGLKVAAAGFESDDPPEKIVAFYRDKLKVYGDVLECHDQRSGVKIDEKRKDLSCDDEQRGGFRVKTPRTVIDLGQATQLKVGTNEKQHVVEVKPRGSGSKFALIYIQARGKGESI